MKVNAVVKRGVNDDGIVALAEHFRGTGHVLRFIEYMDVGNSNGWRLDDVVPADEIVEPIDAVWPLEPSPRPGPTRPPAATLPGRRRRDRRDRLGDPAVLRRLLPGPALGRGPLHTCLFALRGHDLRAPLRVGASDEELAASIRGVWGAPHRPLLRAPHGRDGGRCRRSRCRTSAGDPWNPLATTRISL